jgi:hypothetical protein
MDDRAALSYEYKPALMGAPWHFRLLPEALEWTTGRHSGRVPYGAIARVRLSFRPVSMQSHRFLAEIWPDEGPKLTIASTTWRNVAAQERQDEAYAAFVGELHRRILAAGSRGSFIAGSPALLYWVGAAIFAAAALALAALTVRALQVEAWAGGALIAGFLGLFLWQLGGFFRRNRPGRYRPDALPQALLPRG